ncbi:alpha/beta fold hydrolase [Patulibacter sp.]|uniref:alpha/beta fold hydrolase n=1 Tax=Patulibacter sp. TaxID=1912859 RepID=UPI00272A6EED|nr:alpha/beta fold hydrolase [Patulibacter sp.]
MPTPRPHDQALPSVPPVRAFRTPGRPRLHVETTGEGEAVLAITGWTISTAIFRPFAGVLPDGMRPILFDHRGAGRSGAWAGPVSVAMLAADAARVLDACDVRSAHVIGVSLGAAVAIELAVRMPWRVRSLALVGGWSGGPLSATPGAAEGARTLATLARDSARRGRLWPASFLFSPAFRTSADPATLDAAVRPFLVGRAGTWVASTQALAASCFNRRTDLGAIRCPTLVAHGELDAMSPVRNARTMAAAIPGSRLEVLPGGHAFPFEDPAGTAELCRSWFEDVRGTEPPVEATPRDLAVERLTRPFALQTGLVRNQRDLALRLLGRG